MNPKTGRPKLKHGYKRVTFYLPEWAMPYLLKIGDASGLSASEYLEALITKDKAQKEENDGRAG